MDNKSNSSSNGSRPRTRQRTYKPPPPLEVPDIEQDAAERKRVLNVLAQRRYRQKKRQRRLRDEKGSKEGSPHETEDENSQSVEEEAPVDVIEQQDALPSNIASPSAAFGVDFGFSNSWDLLADPTLSAMLPDNPSGLFPDFSTDEDQVSKSGSGSGSGSSSVNSAVVVSVPPSTTLSSVMFGGSPPSLDSISQPSSSDASFPDSYLLPVHELTILRAMLRIADRIGCSGQQLWSLDALSPFNQGIATPSDQLPSAWQPTPSQVLIPHHPLFDFLPWPGVRDKILGILSLPDEVRPPGAKGPLALVNFAYDFEDNSEGVRIYGSDPYDPGCWEVGQVLFQRWWFLFDREIIDNSNRWRLLRGAPPLALTAGDGGGVANNTSSS
ncbi:hypothetical protein QQS21_001334 [Conoideocrella luteorostrata]|uniref:BZIP domain-containing protein n=1 Tax=Conoideocrella luteorostrata TaxID=1105319 RepID=A0AAJ0FXP6_9HYPO|nr:hypothetical protein QQS21_001334 [Conoideocrella luteorostrata]